MFTGTAAQLHREGVGCPSPRSTGMGAGRTRGLFCPVSSECFGSVVRVLGSQVILKMRMSAWGRGLAAANIPPY